MSDPNFENFDGDWEDFSSDINWNEARWRSYLNDTEKDVLRFLNAYNRVKDKPNHLDEVARILSWDHDDLGLVEELESYEISDEQNFEIEDKAPYTLHKHPIVIATKSLYSVIRLTFEHLLEHRGDQLTSSFGWEFSDCLRIAENNIIVSIQAIDLGDFGLAVCHLKDSLAALNDSLGLLNELRTKKDALINGFCEEASLRFFDLRELWIRVMNDCRHEARRRSNDQD